MLVATITVLKDYWLTPSIQRNAHLGDTDMLIISLNHCGANDVDGDHNRNLKTTHKPHVNMSANF